jgi:hypothetical protein
MAHYTLVLSLKVGDQQTAGASKPVTLSTYFRTLDIVSDARQVMELNRTWIYNLLIHTVR